VASRNTDTKLSANAARINAMHGREMPKVARAQGLKTHDVGCGPFATF